MTGGRGEATGHVNARYGNDPGVLFDTTCPTKAVAITSVPCSCSNGCVIRARCVGGTMLV